MVSQILSVNIFKCTSYKVIRFFPFTLKAKEILNNFTSLAPYGEGFAEEGSLTDEKSHLEHSLWL